MAFQTKGVREYRSRVRGQDLGCGIWGAACVFGIHSPGFHCIFHSMKVIKDGRHRLFENDSETARVVSEMLRELERDGMDAVRRYSQKFDEWSPPSFELSAQQVDSIIETLPEQVGTD